MTEPPMVARLRDTTTPKEYVTPADLQEQLERVTETGWKLNYHDAQCKFEAPSTDDAIIYHLHVPEPLRNRNIGSAMLTVAENTIQEQTTVDTIFASIGAPTDATEYVLREKFDYEIIGFEQKDGLGRVIDAQKRL